MSYEKDLSEVFKDLKDIDIETRFFHVPSGDWVAFRVSDDSKIKHPEMIGLLVDNLCCGKLEGFSRNAIPAWNLEEILCSYYNDNSGIVNHLYKEYDEEELYEFVGNYYVSDDNKKLLKNILLSQFEEEPDAPKETHKHGWVYVLYAEEVNRYKIGMTKRTPDKRIKEFAPRLPFDTIIFATIETDDALDLEQALHDQFSETRLNGSEWFSLTPDNVEYLKRLNNE